VDEQIFHEWYKCNCCNVEPLWGIRFHCVECSDLDVCEACFDAKRVTAGNHLKEHHWEAVEIPERAGGFPVHHVRCSGCQTLPIIGYRFVCNICSHVNLCQKCFFLQKSPKGHKREHSTKAIVESELEHKKYKCDTCGMKPLIGNRFKCDSCFNYNLCTKCFEVNKPSPFCITSHKPFHKFIQIHGSFKEQGDGDEDWKTRKRSK